MGTVIPNTYKFLEKRLTALNATYVTGANLSYADFCWASFYTNIATNANFPFSPMLVQMLEMFPNTKKYL